MGGHFALFRIQPTNHSVALLLFGDGDGGICPVGRHVDVVRLHDQLRLRVGFLPGHHFGKFGIIVGGIEAPVAFRFRRIAADIDEGIFRADAKLRIALLRDPISNIGYSVPGVNGRRAIGETRRERITLSRLRRVNAQFIKSRSSGLLRVTPTDARDAERDAQERRNFPFQHGGAFLENPSG